jgi:hypothetical protein
MRYSPAWQGLVIGDLAEKPGTREGHQRRAEFVSKAAAFAVIVEMFVVVAENKTGMGCVAPEVYIDPGQGLSGGCRRHCELVLHNLGTNAGLRGPACRNVCRDVLMPETSFCFSLSSSRPWSPQGAPVHFSKTSQFQYLDFSIGSPIPCVRVRW